MTAPLFDTALTRLYGTRLPVVAGGLMWLSDPGYVAACAHAGMIGFLTAASYPDDAALRAAIRETRARCAGRPFGVNVSMLPKLVPGERTTAVFELIAEQGVRHVETSGRNPEPWMPLLKSAGISVLHKVPSLRHAEKAQAIGADMTAIVGAECGGHPGLELTGSMVNLGMAASRLRIPFLIGGGIGTGGQIAACIAGGADGVVMGTRLLVADEIPAHDGYKDRMEAAGAGDTMLTMASQRNTIRTLRNETAETVARLEREDPRIGIEALMPHVSGKIGREAYRTGDTRRGMLSAGQALGMTAPREPLGAIAARLEAEARAALGRLARLTTPSMEETP